MGNIINFPGNVPDQNGSYTEEMYRALQLNEDEMDPQRSYLLKKYGKVMMNSIIMISISMILISEMIMMMDSLILALKMKHILTITVSR